MVVVIEFEMQIDIPVSKEDAYPPGPVTDLTVVSMVSIENDTCIQLLWTAPGDDMDTGKGTLAVLNRNSIVIQCKSTVFFRFSFFLPTEIFRLGH